MRPVFSTALAGGIALAGAAFMAGAAWAAPNAGTGGFQAASAACPDDARSCPPEAGVIDRLPDSFFEGGGGVGPQGVDHDGGYAIWVRAGGSAAARGRVAAAATARVSIATRVHVRGRP